MKLYMVRHAIACPRGAPGIREEDRPLTDEGIQSMKLAANGICALGWIPDVLLSSPLVRARQTAEILLKVFGKKTKFQIVRALAPSGSRHELYREIKSCEKKNKSLMLVGHQPSLGEIAGELCWQSPDHFVELRKGGACAIDLESSRDIPKGRILALLTPSILRRLAT